VAFGSEIGDIDPFQISNHSYPIERIDPSESVSGSVSESVSTGFLRQATAINADPFDSDTDSDPDTDGNSNTPYSSDALCLREMQLLGACGTAVISNENLTAPEVGIPVLKLFL
jgi:hypothetical protein